MKKLGNKMISILLVISLLCGFVSCSKNHPNNSFEETESDRRLTISEEVAVYSPDFLNTASLRISDLICRITNLQGGPILGETQKQNLISYTQQSLLPALTQVPIYEGEIDAILAGAEALCNSAQDNGLANYMSLFFRLYQNNLSVLGTERTGIFCYLGAQLYLEYKIVQCEERYEKYGYTWYLEDAEVYRNQLNGVKATLGAETFSSMIGIMMYGTSLMSGWLRAEYHPNNDENTIGLQTAELRMILRQHAKYFSEIQISQEQWSLMAEIFFDQVLYNTNTLTGVMLSTLADQNYPAQAAKAMPALVTFYAAFSEHITSEQLNTILHTDSLEVRLSVVCEVITKCEVEFTQLTAAFSTYASSQSDAEKAVLQSFGVLENCHQYLENTKSTSADELFNAITAYTDANGAADSINTLKATAEAYLKTIVPYLAFTLAYTE